MCDKFYNRVFFVLTVTIYHPTFSEVIKEAVGQIIDKSTNNHIFSKSKLLDFEMEMAQDLFK